VSGAAWVKLDTGLAHNPKVQYLRTQDDGDTLVLCWVLLLCLAGRINDGGRLHLLPFQSFPQAPENVESVENWLSGMWKTQEGRDFLAQMSQELGQKPAKIERVYTLCTRLKMVEFCDGFLVISGWYEHQNAEAMEERKAQDAARAKAYRLRKRQAEADLETYRATAKTGRSVT